VAPWTDRRLTRGDFTEIERREQLEEAEDTS
jgi:hypothetical protein